MDDIAIIENKIYEIRGQKVMLDFDLAEMYGVETKRLKEQVRRNIERFPAESVNANGRYLMLCPCPVFKVANCDLENRTRI